MADTAHVRPSGLSKITGAVKVNYIIACNTKFYERWSMKYSDLLLIGGKEFRNNSRCKIHNVGDFLSDIFNQYLISDFCRLHSDKIWWKVSMSPRGCEIPVQLSCEIISTGERLEHCIAVVSK